MNPNGPGGDGNNNDGNNDDDDDTSDDQVTVTDSGAPVVPSGNPETGLGGTDGSGSSSNTWLAVGLLAFGGAAAAGVYGYRPLRPARARRR